MPLRGILFDVDGTLYSQPPLRALMACELALGTVADLFQGRTLRARIIREFRSIREHSRWEALDRAVDPYEAVGRALRCDGDQVRVAVAEWIHRRPLKWLGPLRRRGLVKLLDELRTRQMPCGVFSDYPAGDKLRALGLAGKFDLALSATDPDVAAFKPAPAGFLVACARWGLRPEQVLYVGDRADVDARGAAAAGMPYALLGRRTRVEPGGWVVRNFKELQSVIRANS